MALLHPGVSTVSIASVTASAATIEVDEISVEEPLEIRVRVHGDAESRGGSIAVTMRTPGADVELAAGFLFTEGIVRDPCEISEIGEASANVVLAELAPRSAIDLSRLDRQSFVSSS